MMMNQGSIYEFLKRDFWKLLGGDREEKKEKQFCMLELQLDLLTQDLQTSFLPPHQRSQ